MSTKTIKTPTLRASLVAALVLLALVPLKTLTLSTATIEINRHKQITSQTQDPQKQITKVASGNPEDARENCTVACSSAEFAAIIQRLGQNDHSISNLLRPNEQTKGETQVRVECVKELVGFIRNLASDELEMKALIQFATSSGPLDDNQTLPLPSGSRRTSSSSPKNCDSQMVMATNTSSLNKQQLDALLLADQELGATAERSKVLPKVIAKVDHYIDSLERFTLTREWSSLISIFQRCESILSLFVGNSTNKSQPKVTSTNSPVALLTQSKNSTLNVTADSISKHQEEPTFTKLRESLPVEVQTLANSLANLFPWHVWPWNNIDLYSTTETFLNHGIFAFSKTTSGPERRIDYLDEMLQTLFVSLKFDTFPKKCADWSKVICDPFKFQDRLVLEPMESTANESMALKERELKVINLASDNKNRRTGELTCIMFSSLSMQQFGASEDSNQQEPGDSFVSITEPPALAWDKLVRKGLKLYGLAREALNDDQWASLYKLLNDLWLRQKISDRVVMLGRVVQLLTSCHMPKEMLESALWKDIYKYKNALNQMSDILIEELNRSSDNGKLTVEQLSLGSKNLNDILVGFLRLMPKLVESLSKTITDQLPDLVNKFFLDKVAFYKGPCKGLSLSDLIPNLDEHRDEIVALEDLICAQLNTKPVFSMMQINNLTNELLAMALNFSNFGNAFSIPEFLSNLNQPTNINETPADGLKSDQLTGKQNTTSVIDELVANPRLAAIVAILQSSPLDPPEVHAELPEFDWVEASTSIALFYESIQRLLSFEGQFVVFPELDDFQLNLQTSVDRSRKLFKRFSKRDPIRLAAYGLDSVMPIALRTFKPMESFHAHCQWTLRDLSNQVPDTGALSSTTNGDDVNMKEAKQWQCLVSSLQFAAHAATKLIATFNSMLENVLAQASALGGETSKSLVVASNSTCVLFDGSLTQLLDSWPQVMELALESILIASTSSPDQQVVIYDTICRSNFSLDPFASSHSQEELNKTRETMCRLVNKSSLSNCAQVLKVDEWKAVMQQLNETWFETNILSVEPSFRVAVMRAHEFLVLFGRAKPSNWSDSLLARILNVNSFWDGLLNKTVSSVERYQERKFELGLQTLEPIVYDNLLASSTCHPTTMSSANTSILEECDSTRDVLLTSIATAQALMNQQKGNMSLGSGFKSDLNQDLSTLIELADNHSFALVEVLLTTVAKNVTKLEKLFSSNNISQSTTPSEIWSRFCGNSIDSYLILDSPEDQNSQLNRDNISLAQKDICTFKWSTFHERLVSSIKSKLIGYPVRQLTRVTLTKWGQLLDSLVAGQQQVKVGKFLQISHWQSLSSKISLITPMKDQPSNLKWIWEGIQQILEAADGTNSSQLSDAFVRTLDQVNCALDSVKGGLSWENLANIYSDRQDILAAHSTINNGFVLASIGVSTFMAPKKFQRLLDEFVRPSVENNRRLHNRYLHSAASTNSSASFCETRDKSRWESVLALPNEAVDFSSAIDSFQELVCETNLEALPQSINPISLCYLPIAGAPTIGNNSNYKANAPLADALDRASKLVSLAVMDAKLVATNDVRPPIFDKSQWSSFWDWWSTQPAAEPRGGLALAIVRAFQTLDSMNSAHVVWRAFFKVTHELTETLAYLVRATEHRYQIALKAQSINNSLLVNSTIAKTIQPEQLVSTLSSLVFPDSSNLITLKTFKQLRYVKAIADYFSLTSGAQESLCNSDLIVNGSLDNITKSATGAARVQLIGYKLNTRAKLNALLCHYHSSQWLTALNVVISARTASPTKRVSLMTKYLSSFINQYKDYDNLESFIHGRQMDSIESVANATVSHLLAASYSLRGSLTLSQISNVSWSSLPDLLDSIDGQLCDSSGAAFGIHNLQQLVSFHSFASMELKRLDLETIACKLPKWNVSQIYQYLSENFDLQKVISTVMRPTEQVDKSQVSTLIGDFLTKSRKSAPQSKRTDVCVTPLKVAAKFLRVSQETIAQMKSKATREKIRTCLTSNTKGKSIWSHLLRYIKLVNKALNSTDELTKSNAWSKVRKTWGFVKQHLVNNANSNASNPQATTNRV